MKKGDTKERDDRIHSDVLLPGGFGAQGIKSLYYEKAIEDRWQQGQRRLVYVRWWGVR